MLRVRDLTVRYGDHTALAHLDLDAAEGEVVCVLGPSGCGKSTLLRAVAGLEPPATGTIHLAGHDLAGRGPHERGVGLMFQDHALFPHRTVAQNVAFGPRMQGLARSEIAHRVDEALALVALTGYGHRAVAELSGGERQRVALARAIAPRPRLLMLDEPLGSLDRALRDRLLEDLPRLFATLGTTVLYVTHDQEEALSLADRVALLRSGRLEQVGTPDELWRRPASGFAARFLGLGPVLRADVRDGVAHTSLGPLPLPGGPAGQLEVVLLPDAVRLLADGRAASPEEVELPGRVERRRFAGTHTVIVVRVGGGPKLTVDVGHDVAPQAGADVRLALSPRGLHPLPDGAEDPGPLDGGRRGDHNGW
jgi:thiamine transport system ATP-binding protein